MKDYCTRSFSVCRIYTYYSFCCVLIVTVQMLPRDPFGRCLYGTLREVIGKIRFITMKNNYLESQGSNLLRYLLEMCREEETRLRTIQKGGQMHSDDVDMGLLPFRAVTNLLMSSPRLSMSRLQVNRYW